MGTAPHSSTSPKSWQSNLPSNDLNNHTLQMPPSLGSQQRKKIVVVGIGVVGVLLCLGLAVVFNSYLKTAVVSPGGPTISLERGRQHQVVLAEGDVPQNILICRGNPERCNVLERNVRGASAYMYLYQDYPLGPAQIKIIDATCGAPMPTPVDPYAAPQGTTEPTGPTGTPDAATSVTPTPVDPYGNVLGLFDPYGNTAPTEAVDPYGSSCPVLHTQNVLIIEAFSTPTPFDPYGPGNPRPTPTIVSTPTTTVIATPTATNSVSPSPNRTDGPVAATTLSLSKKAPTVIAPGSILRYIVTVRNTGRTLARNVVMTDVGTVPENRTFLPAESASGCAYSGRSNDLVCPTTDIEPGQAKTYTLAFSIKNTAQCGQKITNRARVNSSNSAQGFAEASTIITCSPTPTPVTATPTIQPKPSPSPTPVARVDLKVNDSNGPLVIPIFRRYTLSWTSNNVTTCTASGSWSGQKNSRGSQSINRFSAWGNRTYTLTCTGPGGRAVDRVRVSS